MGCLASLAPLLRAPERTVVIGAKNFSEQYILARLIGDRLGQAGYRVAYREGLGSGVALRALREGDIDVYVDYSGTIWADSMHRADAPPRRSVLAGIARFLRPSGAVVLGPLGFQNAYALAMRRDRARALGVSDLADLSRVAPRLETNQ